MLWVWVVLLFVPVQARGAQPDGTELAAFQHRLDQYTALHHRLEGPLPPLQVSSDLSEVHRLMTVLRSQLQASRKNERRGSLLTPGVVTIIRARIAASITIDDIAETAEAVDEHTPPNMRAVQVNPALPEAAPFQASIPPQVLRTLRRCPPSCATSSLENAGRMGSSCGPGGRCRPGRLRPGDLSSRTPRTEPTHDKRHYPRSSTTRN